MSWLSNIFAAIAGVFGFINKKTDLNNTPEMKERANKQNETNQNDSDARDIKNGDIDSLRSKLS